MPAAGATRLPVRGRGGPGSPVLVGGHADRQNAGLHSETTGTQSPEVRGALFHLSNETAMKETDSCQ